MSTAIKKPSWFSSFKDRKSVRETFTSKYWLDDDYDTGESNRSTDVMKLANNRRAISNFVNILTNRSDIRVVYNTKGHSYTDGKTITIGNTVSKNNDFDVSVGLALHEASHILLTDFNTLDVLNSNSLEWLFENYAPEYIHKFNTKWASSNTNPFNSICSYWHLNDKIKGLVKNILNYIEDRRIDAYVYRTAPGYRGYYDSLYVKYFYNKVVDKGLKSGEYRTETIDSYLFRIINLHNPNSDLTALTSLNTISDMIDLPKISRLKTTDEAFKITFSVAGEILMSIPFKWDDAGNPTEDTEGEGSKGSSSENKKSTTNNYGESEASEGSETGEASEASEGSETGEAGEGSETGEASGAGLNSGGGNSDGNIKPNNSNTTNGLEGLDDKTKKDLDNFIDKMKDFLNGEVKKSTITNSLDKMVEAIAQSNMETTNVGEGVEKSVWQPGVVSKGTSSVVVKNFTEKTYDLGWELFPLGASSWNKYIINKNTELINAGLRMGAILGKKLMTRSEERSTVYNRQKTGKIDGRLISNLGFGGENVFKVIEVDRYKKANLHISVDASGSMGGDKWDRTLILISAIAKAVSLIPNLEVQISFRSTARINSTDIPWTMLAYDSRRDKITKIKNLFNRLGPNGTTPEGLCFESIQKQLIPTTNDTDSYFLNISDGEPYFSNTTINYQGEAAFKHTRRQVTKMNEAGIKVLSYFVTENGVKNNVNAFKQMYGETAKFIDVNNINEITKTINELFMTK